MKLVLSYALCSKALVSVVLRLQHVELQHVIFTGNTHPRVCDYFSIPLKRQVVLVLDLVNSCRVSVVHILLMIAFDPVVSLTVLFLPILCVLPSSGK